MQQPGSAIRIHFPTLVHALTQAMQTLGLPPERAQLSARLTAETTRDGIYTHGLNRFPRFVAMVRNGSVDPAGQPSRLSQHGGLERWDGHRGVGNTSAFLAVERAVALARLHGIGCVALGNTNHWMRGGTYGWHAADQGLFAMCWTNTGRNLPAWGTSAASLGNNPLVLAIPRPASNGGYAGGPHVVLDMAMSQFSYGQLEAYAARAQELPFPGGYTKDGVLTTDASAIVHSMRPLPIGFWKGSGLSMVLDLFAALLSGGNATHQISSDPLQETGLSQMFVVIDPGQISTVALMEEAATALIAALHDSPTDGSATPRYPGEQTIRLREENLRLGVPVEPAVWEQVLALAAKWPDETQHRAGDEASIQ